MAVGIVIVAHSARLAHGIVELAAQMTHGKTPLASAGGGENDILGTSVEKILAAIQSVDSPDGVLVLLDLGSAILSTEMALEMLEPEQQKRVRLSHAPLVEGAIAAALDASLGHPLIQVAQAAEKTASVEHLRQFKPLSQPEQQAVPITPTTSVETMPPAPSAPVPAAVPAEELQLTLTNPAGLHARPAALFVQTAARFQARVQVLLRGKEANAASIMEVLSLAARQHDTITLHASGPDASAALNALRDLAQANFYETVEEMAQPQPAAPVPPPVTALSEVTPPDTWHGIAVSAGVALGPAYLYNPAVLPGTLEPRTIAPDQVFAEQQRVHEALNRAAQELNALAAQVRQRAGQSEAAIFEAQSLMAKDPALLSQTLKLIERKHVDAATALLDAGEQQAAALEQFKDTLFAQRAADVRDVIGRTVRALRGQESAGQELANLRQPVILLAHDLAPSDTARLRPDVVLGICTVQGGPTAHAAILARALGIPAIAGLDELALHTIQTGDEVALDAENAVLYHRPSAGVASAIRHRLAEQQKRRSELQRLARRTHAPIMVDEGRPIHLLANIAGEAEAEAARQWGAEGIGLLRTEFLFATATTLPNEEEQRRRYAAVFSAFAAGRAGQAGPVVVRTLDAGADKPMPALDAVLGSVREANPALGLRGVRIHLKHQELLEQQLSAFLLAAADTGIKLQIMFPMITTVEELREARAIFARVHEQARTRDPRVPAHVPLGIMVEVPSAALMAPELAALADFFSIGANDLLQYTLACDRTNATVSYLYHPMQPAVLRLIHQIAQAAHAAGKLVAVCGEIGGDVRLAPVLVGLGVDELSMAPTSLPQVREALTRKSSQEIVELARRVLQLATVAEVEQLLGG
ncbi:MAG: phosphoenolpyruvate--protein phosphotransferase [Ktedonobacteraceae bacterium]|nr:phosphoenolpyruvate--protein phosphotransferase [Ktedonobacteraceae bacterium]